MLLWWGWVALSWHHQLALRIWTQIGLVEKIKQSMSPSTDDFPVEKGTWKRLIWQFGVSTGSSPRVGKWRGCAWPRNLAGRCAILTCSEVLGPCRHHTYWHGDVTEETCVLRETRRQQATPKNNSLTCKSCTALWSHFSLFSSSSAPGRDDHSSNKDA